MAKNSIAALSQKAALTRRIQGQIERNYRTLNRTKSAITEHANQSYLFYYQLDTAKNTDPLPPPPFLSLFLRLFETALRRARTAAQSSASPVLLA